MKKKDCNKIDYGWILKTIIIAFIISILFSFISETAIPNANIVTSILLAFIFIGIGVLFDMIGIAVTTADEAQFHSMATRKVKGAKTAIKLKKNAEKVSSFCNDVIGDICGIISGSTGVVIAMKIANKTGLNSLLVTLIITGLISSLTIGGKAMEKGIAMNKSNEILFRFAKFLNIFIKK